jgi:hypothetical protein
MKLRNLLLTAALFLTAGIASAEIFENEGAIGWNNSTNSTKVDVTLTYYGQEGFTFAAYDTAKFSSLSSFTFQDLEKNPSKYEGSVWLLKAGENSIALSNGVESLGFIGTNGESPHLVFSANGNSAKKWKFYVNDTMEVIAFDKTSDNGGGNYAAEITVQAFGAPLPAPVVTLLIALGFGAALVMYRNRKVKA